MIYFLIPLRSKAVSKKWQRVCQNFERTLDSCYNQTSADFKIIVVCHDIPNLTRKYDESVSFVTMDTRPPSNASEMMKDKSEKIYRGMQVIRCLIEQNKERGGYVFPVDADDLVSNKIAAFFEGLHDKHCYLSKFGYIWYEGTSFLRVAKHLYRTCGSCCIIYYETEELPPNKVSGQEVSFSYLFRNSHRLLPSIAMERGKVFHVLPFPSTIYVLGTGENHSIFYGRPISWKRWLEGLFRIPRFITSNKIKEFNIVK